jgi:hypothetical protein
VHPIRKTGIGHDLRDDRGRTRRWRRLGVHVHLGARDARAQDGLGLERPTVDREPLQHRADLVHIGAGVDQRAESHVTGDAGEAVEPRDDRTGTIRRRDRDALPRDGAVDRGVFVFVITRMVVLMGMDMAVLRHRCAPPRAS